MKLRTIATATSIPAIAALLPDEQLSHAARLVLEGMAEAEAGRALVAALETTGGLPRIGIIHSVGARAEKSAGPLLARLLAGADTATASAAADALGRIGGDVAIRALGDAPPAAHTAAVNGLLACAYTLLASGESSAAREVFRRLDSPQEKESVRTAAFRGILLASGAESLPLAAAAIGGSDRAKQIAALQLVRELEDPATTATIAALLPKVPPDVQTALIEGLAQRGDTAACGAILPLARGTDPAVRLAAINALGILGDATTAPALAEIAATAEPSAQKAARLALLQLNHGDVTSALLGSLPKAAPPVAAEIARAVGGRAEGEPLSSLVGILESARSEAAVEAARDAIAHVCRRAQDAGRMLDLDPLLTATRSGNAAVRAAVLQILPGLSGAKVRATLRAAGDPRAICASRDPELLPDIVTIARSAEDETLRVLAIRGGVRLATQGREAPSLPRRVETLKELLATATRQEERELVIGGIADVPCAESLALAKSLEEAPDLAAAAKQAAERIEHALSRRRIDDGYLLDWQVAGPFRESGKDYRALFDSVFPPEKPDAKDVAWRPLPSGTDAQKPWLLDLLKALGGEQCVAYVRTRIRSDAARPARLEIGSDDGNRVWLNGAPVHANNVARPVTPGSDKVDVALNEGWNTLLLKITQNNLGWEFCVRLVEPDGRPLTGLQVAAEP